MLSLVTILVSEFQLLSSGCLLYLHVKVYHCISFYLIIFRYFYLHINLSISLMVFSFDCFSLVMNSLFFSLLYLLWLFVDFENSFRIQLL